MEKFKPPLLEMEYVCIASNGADLELLTTVSCYFNKPNAYFPMFKFPRVNSARNNTVRLEDDEYVSDVIASKASVLIKNCIARIKCRNIILLGFDENQKTYLNLDRYFNVKVTEIESLAVVHDKLSFLNKQFDGVYYCKRKDLIQGFVVAKKENQLLIVNESADNIENYLRLYGEGLVVIECKSDISDVTIANYAASINSDVILVPGFNHTEIKALKRSLIKWKKEESIGAYLTFKEAIEQRLDNVSIEAYKFATFFTDGVPYGVLYNEAIPCSHVLRSIFEDIFIFNNIFYESHYSCIGSAMVFSPFPNDLGEYPVFESEDVTTELNHNNFYVKKLLNEKATVQAFDMFVGHFPFEILHICSHGGKTDGYYVNEEFKDRTGQQHRIEYEEVVGFSPDQGEYFNVVSKKIFRYFDDLLWMSEELKSIAYPLYVFEDLRKAITGQIDSTVIFRKKLDQIEDSCHVQCYDSIHQGQFHSIGSNGFPLIFNNSCSSWEEFALHLVAGGCRAYIGTLWNVGNKIALDSASIFYSTVFDANVIHTVSIMNKAIEVESYKDIYVFCGLHFSTVRRTRRISKNKIVDEISLSLERWLEKSKTQYSHDLLDNTLKIIQFLSKELIPYFEENRVLTLLVQSSIVSYNIKCRISTS